MTSVARKPTTMPTLGTSETVASGSHIGGVTDLLSDAFADEWVRRGPAPRFKINGDNRRERDGNHQQ